MVSRQRTLQIVGAGVGLCLLGVLMTPMRGTQAKLTSFEQRVAADRATIQRLTHEVRELRRIAGFTPVRGPGVVVTLRDAPRRLSHAGMDAIVHDQDINAVVTELKATGAEAIAISGADAGRLIRLGALTTAQCAGPGMQVNTDILGGPYRVYAIGDPAALENRLRLPRGLLAQTGLELMGMITIERRDNIELPPEAERPSYRFAHWEEVAAQSP